MEKTPLATSYTGFQNLHLTQVTFTVSPNKIFNAQSAIPDHIQFHQAEPWLLHL